MKCFPIISVLQAAAGSVLAIVVADYTVATNAPTGSWNVDWSYVYKYKGSSAVAVGPYWLLTAAHVANDGGTGNVVVNGVTNYQQEIIFHSASDDSQHAGKADLALVRFDKAFPGYYALYSGTLLNKSVVMIGYGNTGTVSSTTWTDSGSGSGTKRWGTQKINLTYTLSYDPDGVVGMTTNDGFWMNFDLGSTTYEAGVGAHDSGGGTFVSSAGTWKLAGINTISGTVGVNGSTFAVSVPSYYAWATNVMNPTGDLDGDGIPNYWEQQYGTTTGLVATNDNDGDGFSNYQEYVADTNPTNAASFFEMSGFEALTNQTIWFNGSTGREYQLFYTTNGLADTNLIWAAAHTNLIWGTGTNSSITVTNVADKAFYRLKAVLP